jgi:hypothetical protein
MASWRTAGGFDGVFLPSGFCIETCADAPEACAAARTLAADEYVQRTIARLALSLIEEPAALARMWEDVRQSVRARLGARIDESRLLESLAGHGAAWFAGRRGTQAGWSYGVTQEFAALLRRALRVHATNGPGGDATEACEDFRVYARRLYARTFPPYPACDRICDQDPPVCLYRHAVADLVATRRFQRFWLDADTADLTAGDGSRGETWRVCRSASYELIEHPEENWPAERRSAASAAANRVGLCFAQQMLADDTRKLPRSARIIIESVIGQAESESDVLNTRTVTTSK